MTITEVSDKIDGGDDNDDDDEFLEFIQKWQSTQQENSTNAAIRIANAYIQEKLVKPETAEFSIIRF